jgi:hypothetical protein
MHKGGFFWCTYIQHKNEYNKKLKFLDNLIISYKFTLGVFHRLATARLLSRAGLFCQLMKT